MDNKWSIDETKRLFDLAARAADSGKGLSSAFGEMARASGKSVNSVRNYYYSQLRLFEMLPEFTDKLGIRTVTMRREKFNVFTGEEIDALIETVLVGKAQGKSVRAIIAETAKGDKKLALRLQNKYRSTVACHRDRVQAVEDRLAERGADYFDPYSKRVVRGSTAASCAHAQPPFLPPTARWGRRAQRRAPTKNSTAAKKMLLGK